MKTSAPSNFLKISIPPGFQEERRYILSTLFEDFLGTPILLSSHKEPIYRITLANGNTLLIEDRFFIKFLACKNYLSIKNLPFPCKTLSLLNLQNLPVLYGNQTIEIQTSRIRCGLDIFASSFFMLSRWEEYVSPDRDLFDRFPARNSIAFQNNFLDRPLVNEYTELLWKFLLLLGYKGERKKQCYRFALTHDVDFSFKWSSPKIKTFLRGCRKNPLMFFHNTSEYLQIRTGRKKDPFNTYSFMMDEAEKNNLISHFYFMAKEYCKYDGNYHSHSPEIKNLMRNIHERRHKIGFHPSFLSHKEAQQWKREKRLIDKSSPQKVLGGRQHYLRFSVPDTWQIWEDAGMEYDSTLSFADREGFRCGCCFPFHPFNIKTRKKLQLLERPLIAMDGSLMHYQRLSPQKISDRISRLVSQVRKFHGEFVFLWHNSSFSHPQYRELFSEILSFSSP